MTMSDDLVERLRGNAREWEISECPQRADTDREGADYIEELEAKIAAYRRDPTLLMPTGPGVDVQYAELENNDE